MKSQRDPLEVTPEELADLIAEVVKWERGAFADSTWRDAPEAIPALADARVIFCVENREGCTYSRAPSGSHRFFLAGGFWPMLNTLQKDTVCRLVWPEGMHFILRDPDTERVVATHALQEPPGFESRGSD